MYTFKKIEALCLPKILFLGLGLLSLTVLVSNEAKATTTICRCSCRLGAERGFHQVCNRTYKSIDNGGYYCYDSGWDFKVQVNGNSDACFGVENVKMVCSGWLVKTDDWFDNDPLFPIPKTPIWLTGEVELCIAD